MNQRDADIIEDLATSFKAIGPIYPVIKTKYGIASGNTRLKANSDWPVETREVRTKYEHLRLMANSNLHLEKSKPWWEHVIGEAANILFEDERLEAGQVSGRLAKDFGLSQRTVLRYLPKKFKDPRHATMRPRMISPEDEMSEHEAEQIRIIGKEPVRASEHRIADWTDAHIKLIEYTDRAHMPYDANEPVIIAGMINKKTGLPQQYWPDMLYYGCIVVEVEGKGSASSDNEVRDAALKSKNWELLHFPNELIMEFPVFVLEYIKVVKRAFDAEVKLGIRPKPLPR